MRIPGYRARVGPSRGTAETAASGRNIGGRTRKTAIAVNVTRSKGPKNPIAAPKPSATRRVEGVAGFRTRYESIARSAPIIASGKAAVVRIARLDNTRHASAATIGARLGYARSR